MKVLEANKISSATYGNLELPNGRLAKINRIDILLGVLGKCRALKGFVGDVPCFPIYGEQVTVDADLNLYFTKKLK